MDESEKSKRTPSYAHFDSPNPRPQTPDRASNSQSTSISLSLADSTPSRPFSSSKNMYLDLESSNTNPTTNATEPGSVEVDNEGILDLSKRGQFALKGVELIPKEDQRSILRLNISSNGLRSLDCSILPLEHCVEIEASQNEFSQLRSFSPLANSLLHLHIADNRINSLGALNNFVHLQTLDLSHNRIEQFPAFDQLIQLTTLDLSSNHLKSVPDLSKLSALAVLNLHGNSIRSLGDVGAKLPVASLRSLDLGGNLVADLCEMHHLNQFKPLEFLTVLGNICTRPDSHKTFSYRPFVFSCVLGDLKVLDGIQLSEQEIIKGEWLHAQGRSRSFRPATGAHAKLCAYLTEHCPLLSTELALAVNNEVLGKVIQKRREYNAQSTSKRVDKPIGQKKNPESGAPRLAIRNTPAPAVGSIEHYTTPTKPKSENLKTPDLTTQKNPSSPIKSASKTVTRIPFRRVPPDPVSNLSVAFSPHPSDNTTFVPTEGQEQNIGSAGPRPMLPNSSSTKPLTSDSIGVDSPLTSQIDRSVSTVAQLRQQQQASPLYVVDTSNGSSGRKKGWTRKLRILGTSSPSEAVRHQQLLQKRVDQLGKLNELLMHTNEEHVKTFKELAAKIQHLETQQDFRLQQELLKFRHLLMPTPTNLACKRQTNNSVLLSWENVIPLQNSVDHYELLLNDNPAGKVTARNKRILITDVNHEEGLKIAVQAFSTKLGNVHSEHAELVMEPGERGEGKENLPVQNNKNPTTTN